MFKKILVPLDGSVLAELALKPAVALAQKEAGEIILLRVPGYREMALTAGSPLLPELSPDIEQVHDRVKRYLKSVRQVHAFLDVPIQLRVTPGDRAGVIVDTAAGEDVDLIVISTHGRTGLTRWVLGSVTEKVLRAAPCPVLAVRSDALPARILVPLDGSPMAETALAPALAIARHFEATVTLVRVLEPVELDEVGLEPSEPRAVELVAQLEAELRQTAGEDLHAVAGRAGAGEPLETAVVSGVPAQAILDYAEAQDIDLIAMTTHGLTGQPRWAYGSVTERVVHGAHCALLIIRAAT